MADGVGGDVDCCDCADGPSSTPSGSPLFMGGAPDGDGSSPTPSAVVVTLNWGTQINKWPCHSVASPD